MSRTLVPLLVFLVTSLAILFLVADRFLVPAMAVSEGLDPPARRQLAALSALVLSVVLTALFAAALLVVRPGRFFLPRKREPRTRTAYPDAWAESARRMPTPPPDDEADDSTRGTH